MKAYFLGVDFDSNLEVLFWESYEIVVFLVRIKILILAPVNFWFAYFIRIMRNSRNSWNRK